jgi:branched-chain amino acid transport system substrate-binding protein
MMNSVDNYLWTHSVHECVSMSHLEDNRTTDGESRETRGTRRRELLKTVGGLSGVGMVGFAGCTGISGGGDSSSGNGSAGGNATNGAAGGGSEQALTVGVIIPMTGNFSSLGSLYRPAFKAWENLINDRGGINGYSIDVRFEDNQSTATRTTKIARQFVQDGVAFMVNAYSSPLTRAAGNIAESAEIPLFSTGSINPKIAPDYDYLFQFEPTPIRTADGSVLEGKTNKIASWAVDLAWAKYSQKKLINQIAPKHNLDIVLSTTHSQEQRDFSSLVQKAKNAGANAILTANYPEHVIPQTRAINTSEWSPSYYSAITATSDNIYNSVGKKAIQGLAAPTPWTKAVDRHPDTDKFIKRYESLTNVSEAEYHGALAFGSLQNFGEAVRALGDAAANGQRLKQWYDQNTAPTILGTSKFDDQGIQVGFEWVLSQWHGSDNPLVYPPEVAQAKLIYPKPWP